MRCIYCESVTDYSDINQEAICILCAEEKNLVVCPQCGFYYDAKTSNGGLETCGREECNS